jgi:hypothetical protein
MFGKKPNVSYLRVFGCKCFILKKGLLDKFESRTSDGIMLGYPGHSKGYRVLNLETNTIVESCDVTFDEASPASPDLSGSPQESESIFQEEDEFESGVGRAPTSHVPEADPLVTSSTIAEGPVPTTSSSAMAPSSPTAPLPTSSSAEVEAVETTSTLAQVPVEGSRRIQRDHPSAQIIGDISKRVTR